MLDTEPRLVRGELMRCNGPRLACVLVLLGVLVPAQSAASEGAIEINQARALAGGVNGNLGLDPPGFPVEIYQSGAYVLTGNLTVDANTNAINVRATQVTIDMNGFTVSAPPGGAGSGIGIWAVYPGVAVRNGSIRDMGSHGIALRGRSRVEDVSVLRCDGDGINMQDGGLVLDSVVSTNRGNGLTLGAGSGYAHVVSTWNIGEAVSGGLSLGENLCTNAQCASPRRRRFYLTPQQVSATGALGACAEGFHMASIWEIHDPGLLDYDPGLGITLADSGSGPAGGVDARGWIRTGLDQGNADYHGNCNVWTSTEGRGVVINLKYDPLELHHWDYAEMTLCALARNVWCVEDW